MVVVIVIGGEKGWSLLIIVYRSIKDGLLDSFGIVFILFLTLNKNK